MTDSNYISGVPDALPPGYRFDEFEIQQTLSSSLTGIIYQARDHQLERQVIIREFMPRTLVVRGDSMQLIVRSDRDYQAFHAGLGEFLQEARQQAQVNHPGLPQVLRFWSENGTAYIATRLYQGMTLAELQQQPEWINEAWLYHILPVLCDALAALHNAGYLHRHISLESILIQENDIPVLLYADVAYPGNPDSKTLLLPGFAPLEQYTADLEVRSGPWTDIYALGAVLYTLITGSTPPASVTRSIQDSCTPLAENRPDGYSLALLQAVDRALALKPEDRPQSIEAFSALLNASVDSSGERIGEKKSGTALISLEKEAVAIPVPLRKRYQSALQIIASLAVGIVIGTMVFGYSHPETAATLSDTPDASGVPAAPATISAAADGWLAHVYVKVNEGEKLIVNGIEQKITLATNGFAFLQLPAGIYDFALSNSDNSRTTTLTIGTPGTWLVNPQA